MVRIHLFKLFQDIVIICSLELKVVKKQSYHVAINIYHSKLKHIVKTSMYDINLRRIKRIFQKILKTLRYVFGQFKPDVLKSITCFYIMIWSTVSINIYV